MYDEELIEKGIVIDSHNGIADIAIVDSANCEECSAKILCKPGKDNSFKTLRVDDKFNAAPGDEVTISIEGKKLLATSFLLYGVPLLLFVGGIFAGMHLFELSGLKEVFSFFLGLILISIYFGAIFLHAGKLKMNKVTPQIISIRRKSQILG
ncbi:MAG: SoxR reducing system RseC family protein [bacterium]